MEDMRWIVFMSPPTLMGFVFSANKESLKIPETPGVSVALAALFFAQVFEVKFLLGSCRTAPRCVDVR